MSGKTPETREYNKKSQIGKDKVSYSVQEDLYELRVTQEVFYKPAGR